MEILSRLIRFIGRLVLSAAHVGARRGRSVAARTLVLRLAPAHAHSDSHLALANLELADAPRWLERVNAYFAAHELSEVRLAGSVSPTSLVIQWLTGHRRIGDRTLLISTIMAIILSVQLISLGLMAEPVLRNTRNDPVEDFIQEAAGGDKTGPDQTENYSGRQ